MRSRTGPRRCDQMGLFQPRAMTPCWTDLPAEVRRRTLALLAKLLRQHVRERRGAEVRGE